MHEILESLSKQNQLRPFHPEETDEYRDGKWFCTKCLEQKWGWLELQDGSFVFMNTPCKCQRAVRDAEKAKEAADERRKSFGMDETARRSTFETDKGWCDEASVKLCKKYVERFPEYRPKGKGMLLYGRLGTGKSFLSYCIANAVGDMTYPVVNWLDAERSVTMPKHYNVYVARADKAYQEYVNMGDEYWRKMEYTDLVVLSDLGREAQSERLNEFLNSWIDWLYEHMVPMIVTTNLGLEVLMDEADKRMPAFDRMWSRCRPVEVKPSGQLPARQLERMEMLKEAEDD